jgi:hypothetical protein
LSQSMPRFAEGRVTLLPEQSGAPADAVTLAELRASIRFGNPPTGVPVRVVAGPTELLAGEAAKVVFEIESDKDLPTPLDFDFQINGMLRGRGRIIRSWEAGSDSRAE